MSIKVTTHKRHIGLLSGPDAQDSYIVHIGNVELSFFSSELRLRGNHPVSQPHQNSEGYVLCWNGEVSNRLGV